MEENAPNQTIGTGTLEIKPDFQAVREEMAQIERQWDQIGEKAKAALSLSGQLREAEEGIGRLAEKIKEVNLDGMMDRFEQRMEAMLQRMKEAAPAEQAAPREEQPDSRRILSDAISERALETLTASVTEINTKMDTLVMQATNQE